jgi:hypothetical protein
MIMDTHESDVPCNLALINPKRILFYPDQISLLSDCAHLDPALPYRSLVDDPIDDPLIQFKAPLDFSCSHVYNKSYQPPNMMDNNRLALYIFRLIPSNRILRYKHPITFDL